MRTYFQDFTKDNGLPITVEYGVEGSYSPTTYSPNSGACGGDAPEFSIISAWPRTEEYDGLVKERTDLELTRYGQPLHPAFISPEMREKLEELDALIEPLEKSAALTDAERERMEAWLAEHYVEEPEEIDF